MKKTDLLEQLATAGATDIEVGSAPTGFTGYEASCLIHGHGARAGGATKKDALAFLVDAVRVVKAAYGLNIQQNDSTLAGPGPASLPSVGP